MDIKSIGNTVRLLKKNNGVQMAQQRHRNAKTTALFLKGSLVQKARGRFSRGNTAFLG